MIEDSVVGDDYDDEDITHLQDSGSTTDKM